MEFWDRYLFARHIAAALAQGVFVAFVLPLLAMLLFQEPFVPLEEMERTYILSVLTHAKGNKTEAARILGIERKTLARKLKRTDGGDMDDLEGDEP